MNALSTSNAPRPKLILAFATIYIIWGSTYLAIKYAIVTLPPFLMSGSRYLVAGILLYIYCLIKGKAKATASHWLSATIIGFLLFVVGNGAVAYGEKTLPSGIAALVVATVPIWFVLLEWLFFKGSKPNLQTILGLVLGFIGMIALVGPNAVMEHGHFPVAGAIIITIGAIGWSFGSLYSSRVAQPAEPLLMTALQMLCGGILQCILSTSLGEPQTLVFSHISSSSIYAWLYLIFFGSLVAFTAYSWLVRTVPARLVSTYAYVNPVVAVILGSIFISETIHTETVVAAIIILAAVVLITRRK